MKHIIIVGNPVEGYEFYGPFESPNDAIKFHDEELGYTDHWKIAKLNAPEGESK